MEPVSTTNPSTQQPAQQPQMQQKENGSTLPMFIAIAVLVLVLLGGIGLFYLSYKSSQPKPTATTNQTINQTTTTANNQPNQTGSGTQVVSTPSATSLTDQTLNQDTQQVDQSISSLDTDMNSVNQTLTDQQGDLSSQE